MYRRNQSTATTQLKFVKAVASISSLNLATRTAQSVLEVHRSPSTSRIGPPLCHLRAKQSRQSENTTASNHAKTVGSATDVQ